MILKICFQNDIIYVIKIQFLFVLIPQIKAHNFKLCFYTIIEEGNEKIKISVKKYQVLQQS